MGIYVIRADDRAKGLLILTGEGLRGVQKSATYLYRLTAHRSRALGGYVVHVSQDRSVGNMLGKHHFEVWAH
jgi:hypothetical protein